jgi:hypothetical protein
VFPDLIGDTFGAGPVQHDITSVHTTLGPMDLHFVLMTLGPIAPASAFAPHSIVGSIDLDTDKDAGTGAPPQAGLFGPPPAPVMGDEFFVDLFSEAFHPGLVDITNAVTLSPVGVVPIMYGPTSFSLTIPLAMIGDDGLLNYAAIVGTFSEPTDEIPNGTEPLMTAAAGAGVVPEPTSLALLGLGGLSGFVSRFRSRRRR